MTLRQFPEDFLFGVATSDSQCEAFIPEFEDIRDLWYKEHRQQQRERATDFWARYKEDIALAQGLGCRMFRFSVAWSRVEPEEGKFSADALDHYSEVVDAIRAAGMEPLVTLLHFVWPIHVEKRGGLIADDFPSTYARYAECVAKRFGNRVKYWVTFNEPNILLFGYTKPWWERNYFAPPGLPPEAGFAQQMEAQTKLMRNLFLAHTAGRRLIKALQAGALIGVNSSVLGLPVWVQNLLDRNVIKLRTEADAQRSSRSFSERKFLEQGKIDVLVATFTKTNERASQLDFGEVYLVAHERLLVRADSPFQTVGDLSGKPVAVVKTSTAQQVLTMMSHASPVPVSDHDEGFKKLESGHVCAFLSDDLRLLPAVKAYPGLYRLLDGDLSEEPYAPAITKGNPLLLDAVDKALGEFISSGRWAESYQANLGGPAPDPPQYPKPANLASLSGIMEKLNAAGSGSSHSDLLQRVKARGRIRIGVKSDAPGMGYLDSSTGQWSGMEIDIARTIARYIFGNDQALELVPLATTKRIPSLRSVFRFMDPVLKAWALFTSSVNTNWWQLGMAGKLSSFLCPSECVGQMDYVGFDYYWGIGSLSITRALGLVDALVAGRMENAPVYPKGLYNWLKEYGKLFPKLPILIIENGCVSVADKIERATYISLHLKEVQRVMSDGVNVVAYICWSITSNRELGHRFAPDTDFGLYHIDLDTDPLLVRQRTASAETYANIIAHRNVPD